MGGGRDGKEPPRNTDVPSYDDDEDEEDTFSDETPQPRGLKFIWTFIEGAMISMIIRLNRVSRHYRYVMRVLAREKIQLKVRQKTIKSVLKILN